MKRSRRKKALLIAVIMSLLATTRLAGMEAEIRTIDFLTIMTLGMCFGVVLSLVAASVREMSAKEPSVGES